MSRAVYIFFILFCGCAAAGAEPAVILLPPHANLTWTASPSDWVVGYNLYYGNATRSYQDAIQGGTNLSTTVTNLVLGLTYYFAVTAVDVWGDESDFSAETFWTIPQVLELVLADGDQTPTNQPLTNQFLQSSPDLINWQNCDATTRSNAWFVVQDPAVPQEFYRLVNQPAAP